MLSFGRIMIQARLAKMEERGASAVEYGLLVAGIAAVIVLVVVFLGDNIKDAFQETCNSVGNQGSTATACVKDGPRWACPVDYAWHTLDESPILRRSMGLSTSITGGVPAAMTIGSDFGAELLPQID